MHVELRYVLGWGSLKNWFFHVTKEEFPNPQMTYHYVLRCFFEMGMVFHQTVHSGPSLKKKKVHICGHKTLRSYLNELEMFKSTAL